MDASCAAVIDLLGPLRLGADGWSEQAIAVAILLGSALGWALAPLAGRLSDRVGPVRVALMAGIGMSRPSARAAAAGVSATLGLLVVISGRCSRPRRRPSSRSPRGADESGSATAPCTACSARPGRAGFVIGQAGGGAIADAVGDEAAYAAAAIVIALLLVVTVALPAAAVRWRSRSESASSRLTSPEGPLPCRLALGRRECQ